MSRYYRARKEDDKTEMSDVWREIESFNSVHPKLRITRLKIMQSVRSRDRRIDQAENGVYLPNNRKEAMEAGRFARED